MFETGRLNDEEKDLLKKLVKSWHDMDWAEQTKVETKLAEIVANQILPHRTELPKWLEHALYNIDFSLNGRIKAANRVATVNKIGEFVRENPNYRKATAEL